MPEAGSPAVIAAALSFCVGIWSLIFGFLNIGFIFDFISLPMLLGFTAGISYIAIMSQIPSILGLVGVTPVMVDIMSQTIAKLSEIKPITFGIGATSILLLAVLQFIGKKWGQKKEIIRIITIQRNLFVLILYTVISYEVNKDREEPLWLILGTTRTEIQTVRPPDMQLVKTLLLSSITVWVGTAVEHVCLAKTFGHINRYTIDQSQELVYLGVVNIANSMIGGIPVGGGDMARTSVNSALGVHSPLSGLFTSSLLMVAMYVASGLIKWIPQATVAAVIIVSVIDQMPPMAHMSKYWQISFMDFLGFLITFNMTMLLTAETGIGLSFAAMIIYTFFRLMFPVPTVIKSTDLEDQYDVPSPLKWGKGYRIPEGTLVISFETDVIFVNAERIKRHVLNSAMTSLSGVPASRVDRAWNSRRDKYAEYLRRKVGMNVADTFYPRFRVLVLDLSSTSFVDSTGMQAFEDIKRELRLYGGPDVEFRFVGMNEVVQTRFKRAGWKLASPYNGCQYNDGQTIIDGEEEIKDSLFEHLPLAIHHKVETNSEWL